MLTVLHSVSGRGLPGLLSSALPGPVSPASTSALPPSAGAGPWPDGMAPRARWPSASGRGYTFAIRARHVIGRGLTALLAIGIWSTPGLAQKTDVIELSSGQKYFGSIQPASLPDQLEVALGEQETIGVRHVAVVRITPISRSFWSRLDSSIDLGLSFLQQNNQLDYNLGVQVKYTEANSRVQLKIKSIVRLQNEVSTTNRQEHSLAYIRSFGQRWLWSGLGSFASNAELDLDARGSGGGGVGRLFVQTNKFTFASRDGTSSSRIFSSSLRCSTASTASRPPGGIQTRTTSE